MAVTRSVIRPVLRSVIRGVIRDSSGGEVPVGAPTWSYLSDVTVYTNDLPYVFDYSPFVTANPAVTSYTSTASSMDSATGVFTFTAAAGSYPVTHTATNSEGSGNSREFTITVIDGAVPELPKWDIVPPVYSVEGISEGTGLDMAQYVNNKDDWPLTTGKWSIEPTTVATIDENGLARGKTTTVAGRYSMTVTAENANGASTCIPFDWDVIRQEGYEVRFDIVKSGGSDLDGFIHTRGDTQDFTDELQQTAQVDGDVPALVGQDLTGQSYIESDVGYGIKTRSNRSLPANITQLYGELTDIPNLPPNGMDMEMSGQFTFRKTDETPAGEFRRYFTIISQGHPDGELAEVSVMTGQAVDSIALGYRTRDTYPGGGGNGFIFAGTGNIAWEVGDIVDLRWRLNYTNGTVPVGGRLWVYVNGVSVGGASEANLPPELQTLPLTVMGVGTSYDPGYSQDMEAISLKLLPTGKLTDAQIEAWPHWQHPLPAMVTQPSNIEVPGPGGDQTISAIAKHPYAQFEWFGRLDRDSGNPDGWEPVQEITEWDDHISGQGTKDLVVSDSLPPEAVGSVFCRVGNPLYEVEGVSAGPVWTTPVAPSVDWADAPASIADLSVYATAQEGALQDFSNATNGGVLSGTGNVTWTAPAHGLSPGVTSHTVDGTDDTGTSTSPSFSATVTGAGITSVTVPPVAATENQSISVTVTVDPVEGGVPHYYLWSYTGSSGITGETTNEVTITSPQLAGGTLSCRVRKYEDKDTYQDSGSNTVTVTEEASAPVWLPTVPVEQRQWAETPARIEDLAAYIVNSNSPGLTFSTIADFGTITVIPAGEGVTYQSDDVTYAADVIAFGAATRWDAPAHTIPGNFTGNVLATNDIGSEQSPLMTVEVIGLTPSITIDGDKTVMAGTSTVWNSQVTNVDGAPLDYQWDVSGLSNSTFTGETTDTLTVSDPNELDTGAQITCTVRAYDTSDNWMSTSPASTFTITEAVKVWNHTLTVGGDPSWGNGFHRVDTNGGDFQPRNWTPEFNDIHYLMGVDGSSHIRLTNISNDVGEPTTWVEFEYGEAEGGSGTTPLGWQGATPVSLKLYQDAGGHSYWKHPANVTRCEAGLNLKAWLDDPANQGATLKVNLTYHATGGGDAWPWSNDGQPEP